MGKITNGSDIHFKFSNISYKISKGFGAVTSPIKIYFDGRGSIENKLQDFYRLNSTEEQFCYVELVVETLRGRKERFVSERVWIKSNHTIKPSLEVKRLEANIPINDTSQINENAYCHIKYIISGKESYYSHFRPLTLLMLNGTFRELDVTNNDITFGLMNPSEKELWKRLSTYYLILSMSCLLWGILRKIKKKFLI